MPNTDASAWLHSYLTDAGGPVPVQGIRKDAAGRGLSWRSVERAKAALGLDVRRRGFGAKAYWTWALPTAEPGVCSCCGLPKGLRPMEVAGLGGTVYVRA